MSVSALPQLRSLDVPAPARRAVAAYLEHLAHPGDHTPIVVAWASGRVNLIGEHTDYNDGLVLPVAIDRVLAVAGRPAPEQTARCFSVHHEQRVAFATRRETLLAPTRVRRAPLWMRLVRGVLTELASQPGTPLTPGFSAAIAGDVPVGGGMSSSAALEVAIATFAGALGGPVLPPLTTAQLCQRAEHRGAGVEVGIMDQAAACLGQPGQAILLDCRSLAYEHVPVALPDIALAVYDTRVPHSLASSAYNERRHQCQEAVARLAPLLRAERPQRTVTALRDVTLGDLRRHGRALPTLLLRRARHVVGENVRVERAVAALRAGEAEALGTLLFASHASLRDDYQVSCPELDAVVAIASAVPGVLGARMMGAGFGGSALILVRRTALPALEATLAREYPVRAGRVGSLHVCSIAGGPQAGWLPA